MSLLFLLFSCKKDILTTANDESTKLNKQAKESLTVQKVSYKDFLKTVRSEQLGTLKEVLFRSEVTGGINNFSVKVNSEPDMLLLMDQIKKVKTNDFTTYTVPLANKTSSLKEFKNLLISEKGNETIAILITYKPDESWIKAHEKGLYVPFHGKIFRKVIDLKANKSISKAGGISVATVFCQFIQVVAPVAVSCNGTEEENNIHWPGEPCQNDGVDQYNAPRYVYVTKLVKDCQDDGTALPPELWRQAPVEVTPLGPIVHPPTEPTPPPPPCLAGIDGTCDGSTPPPPPPISLSQFLIEELSITNNNHLLILNSSNSLQSLIYVYSQHNGYTQENKNYVYWILDYFLSNQNVDVNEFKNQFLIPSEGQDGEYDAQFWENPSLNFPVQNLPTWVNFAIAYPKHEDPLYETPQLMYNSIGGQILSLYNSNPSSYQNTCAIRLSKALNYSGVTITAGTDRYLGEDGKYYFISAAALLKWMKKTFGTPSGTNHLTGAQGGNKGQNFPSLLAGKKGIYIMTPNFPGGCNTNTGFCASGHADLIYNSVCDGGCYFGATGGINEIFIWELQ